MNSNSIYKRGFTLIELLTVLAIIAILAVIVGVSLNSARPKARDQKRIEEVKEIKGALELYFSSNGQYPSVGADNTPYAITALLPALVPNYLQTLPQDPQYANVSGTPGDYQYVRGGAGSYGILIYLETAQGSVPANSTCVTGANVSAAWFSGPPACPF